MRQDFVRCSVSSLGGAPVPMPTPLRDSHGPCAPERSAHTGPSLGPPSRSGIRSGIALNRGANHATHLRTSLSVRPGEIVPEPGS